MTAVFAILTFARANWRLVVAGLAALALLLAAYWLYQRGRDDEQAKQNAALMRAYEQRTVIDEDLDKKSPRELCLDAGGGGACSGLPDEP